MLILSSKRVLLCRVHKGRELYQNGENFLSSSEQVLCIGDSNKRPVLKWKNNMAWPGKVTLTNNALYFEVVPCLFYFNSIIQTYYIRSSFYCGEWRFLSGSAFFVPLGRIYPMNVYVNEK